MKPWLWIVGVAASAVFAEEPGTVGSQPVFAEGWRVTGFMRQGRHAEASLEREGLMPRFVKEGDRLPGDILVLTVNYDDRSVALGKADQTVVIRQAKTMMASSVTPSSTLTSAALATPLARGAPMSAADKATAAQRESGRPAAASPDGKSLVAQGDTSRQGGGSSSVTQSPAAPDTGQAAAPAADPAAVATTSTTDKPAATQDGSGRWIIAFPNGNTLEMQSYVERQGSVPAAIQYVQGLIAQETDPERLDYRRQQLFALTQMSLSRRR